MHAFVSELDLPGSIAYATDSMAVFADMQKNIDVHNSIFLSEPDSALLVPWHTDPRVPLHGRARQGLCPGVMPT